MKGEEIIIMGDFNKDLDNPRMLININMRKIGLNNVLQKRYGKHQATHNQGSECIDSVFATPGVNVNQGGYIPFKRLPGDHKWMWLNIKLSPASNSGKILNLTRKATSKIPSVKKEFNDRLNKQLNQHGISKKIDELIKLADVSEAEHSTFSNIYESIDEVFRRSVQYANKKCKKGRQGPIPYSEETKHILGTYTLLKLILFRFCLKGHKTRPLQLVINRLAKKVKSNIPLMYTNKKDILKQCKFNAKEYKDLKNNADEFRNAYVGNLANELSLQDGKEASYHLHQILQREKVKKH